PISTRPVATVTVPSGWMRTQRSSRLLVASVKGRLSMERPHPRLTIGFIIGQNRSRWPCLYNPGSAPARPARRRTPARQRNAMPEKSTTLVLSAPRKFEVVERSLPAAGEGEALVRIAATAVCHTDLDMYTGGPANLRYPIVLGHESTGTIAALGSDAPGLAPGQPVSIHPVNSCGHCHCRPRGRDTRVRS